MTSSRSVTSSPADELVAGKASGIWFASVAMVVGVAHGRKQNWKLALTHKQKIRCPIRIVSI
jgi:hypothetical protein